MDGPSRPVLLFVPPLPPLGHGSGPMLQSPVRIRSNLLLLAAVVVLPGFLAAAIAVEKVRYGEREAALRGLRETVRATALLVDGQVQRSLGALTALGNSHYLQSGDMEAFYRQALAIDQPPDVWTLLLDDTGTQKLNTAVPFGTPPPPPAARERVAQVLAGRSPLVTDVVVGPATKRLLTTIYLPAKPSPAGRFVVAQAFSVEHWKKTVLQPHGRTDWVVAVIDRTGKFISRSHNTDEMLGRQARPELVAAAAAANDGLIRHKTLEEIDSYDAFTHSALTGWTIAVAAPVESIEASARQAVVWLALGIGSALMAALLGASIFARTLIRAMETVSVAARALGRGQQPVPSRTSVHEVNVLSEALSEAGRLLSAEQGARAVVEAERERLLDNERSAREAAQGENAAKDQFLALLGHELRNPLAAIAGATQVLARGHHDDPTTRRFLAIIQRQNRHLRQIVDDLLEVSRMLSGKIVLVERPLDLAECVRSCIDALRTTDRAEGYRLEVRAREVWVSGDPARLEQIFNNIVTNSLKFSPAGSEIRIDVAGEDGRARVEITDAGAGIGAELLPHIFEPFVQGPPLPGRQPSGLGIGLALVKQLVELHGGVVRVRSDGAGCGSTFIVSLPRIEAPGAARQVENDRPTSACRVLLVEDNADAREATGELLRGLGYHIVEAEDGEQAMRLAIALTPDVIVMDLGLPGKSGFQVAAEMRKTASLRHVPIIALSGYGQERDRQASSEAGFDVHLVKPIEPEVLVRAIEDQFMRSRARFDRVDLPSEGPAA